MACSNCKEKKLVTKELTKVKSSSMDKWAGWIILLWFLLGCYGLYSLIKDLFA